MSPMISRRGRRSLLAALALSASATTLAVPAAQGADRVPFIVVGTSDVSDSGLVANVLEPRFEALYPQYDLQYVAKGTGAALTDARNGLAAATIVHAASVENQFVADGYSLEQYGRLAFWGDYVLLGPNSDPAGVAASAPNDVVSAFEKVAAAGAAGRASFVTRGGTPGTAVQEHALWKLTSGVATCTVGAPSGGGTRPKAPADPSTVCTNPDDQTTNPATTPPDNDGAARPTWYGSGSSTSQADNVNIANMCSTGAFPNGNCYVFTDRGTYKNLRAQGLAQNLKIVTRDNTATARGGRDALINVFHAYGVNPTKFANPANTKTDPVAARLFLDFITSTSVQSAIGAYLSEGNDPTFTPAAAPITTLTASPKKVKAGKKYTISGTIANAVPGYPTLAGVTVDLQRATSSSPLAVPATVATTTTDANGAFTFRTKLKAGGYRVGIPQFTKIELPTLNPAFGDILSASSTDVVSVNDVKVKQRKAITKLAGGRFKLVGKLGSASDGRGKVTVYAARSGKPKKIGQAKVKDGKKRFVFTGRLAPGTYRFAFRFKDTGATASLSDTVKLTIRR